jgi:hypothetical protein
MRRILQGDISLLPGYGKELPTLEIFSYDALYKTIPAEITVQALHI